MDTNLSIPQGLDPGVVNLARSIRHQESGGDYNKSGDSGSSLGAYQWNNQPNGKSIPLQKGELPSNFVAWAKEANLDPTDFSPKNQDMVAYAKIKKLKDAGHNVVDIAAIWNGGDPKRQDPNYVTPNGLPSQKKGVYDVPSYAKAVNDYYQELKAKTQGGTSNQPRKTFAESVQNIQNSQPNADLQAGNPATPGNTAIGNTVANIIPGTKLAQGAGYALANSDNPVISNLADLVSGTKGSSQKGLLAANGQGIDIMGQLNDQIKRNKAKGKDTSRLEKAVKELGGSLQNEAGQVSDVGTGGITNKQVKLSAAGLATLPALAYGGSLVSGILKGGSALASPELESVINMPLKEFNTLSSAEKLDALTASLADEGQALGASGKAILQKAIQEVSPNVLKEAGIGSFSELNPRTAKLLGLSWKAVKLLGGGLLAGAGLGEGGKLVKGLVK